MKRINLQWNSKILLFILTILCLFSISYSAPWEDLDQEYRQQINLSGASSTITNYTYQIDLNSGNVGTYFNFSEIRNSMRFYYFNGSTNSLLPHYVDSWSNGSETASLLIKVPELNSGLNSEIWMYYGDLTKINVENYCDVFIFCDFFEDGTINNGLQTTDQDLVAGTAFSESSGTLSVTAGGADTWSGNDEYGSVFIPNISGDIDIQLEITSSTTANAWTKVGLMLKNDMTARASSTGYHFMARTPSNRYSFQSDSNNNGFLDVNSQGCSASTSPSYVRLVKSGTQISGFCSQIDMDTWTSITTRTSTTMNSLQDVGLSVTSHAGSTLATATFDNFTIRRHTSDTITTSFGSEEEKSALNTIVDSPSILTTTNILQNTTFEVNITVECTGVSSDCFNVTGTLQYNNSGTFENISESSSTPFWTTLENTQNCIIFMSSSCTFSWIINATGISNTLYHIRGTFSSNETIIGNTTSQSIPIQIVIGNTVNFNMSSFTFGSFLKDSGNQSTFIDIIAENGNNTNLQLSCISGDCSTISNNFVNGITLNEGNTQTTTFSCDDSISGMYSADFSLTSDEFDGNSSLSVSCEILPIFGPINGTIISPPSFSEVGQNRTFTLTSNLNCTGNCGEVSGIAQYIGETTIYKRELTIEIKDSIPSNYQILLELNSSHLGSNFNWSHNCNDLGFESSMNTLDYFTEICDTAGEELAVWIETDTALTNGTTYLIEMTYGNSSAISQSSATNTFRQNEIHLTTGRCPNGVTGCNHIDNVADSEYLKENLGTGSLTIDGTGYVTQINNPNNPYGSDDFFFMRYRTLYIPSSGGSFSFGIASDDGANAGLWSKDGYGYGLSTPSFLTSSQDIVSDWYGGHGSGTCGSTAAIERTRTITVNTPYWIDYIMDEGNGGQDAEFCIDTGSGYNNFGSGSFSGEFFAREYVENEPELLSIGTEQGQPISTTPGVLPFYTVDSQPQTCTPIEDGNCSFTWVIHVTGEVNTSWDINILYSSNISSIESKLTPSITVNITDNIIPVITLLSPANNSKFIHGGSTTFSWQVDDDDTVIISDLYLNGVYNISTLCLSGNVCSRTIDLTENKYDWEIRYTDLDNNSVTSDIYTLYSIEDYHIRFSKHIYYLNSNIYSVELNTQNNLNFSRNYTQLSFISNTFNYGSLTRINDFSTIISSPYLGTILGWDANILSNEILNINYSITSNTANSYLLDEFIIVG